MKLTLHSKVRIRERTNLNHKERNNLFRLALMKGKSIAEIKNEKIKQFLMSKKNCKVKLYKDYVFIYSKNSHRLYTMYKLPEKLREEKDERRNKDKDE